MNPSDTQAYDARKNLLLAAAAVAVFAELLWGLGIGAGVHATVTEYIRQGNYFLSACMTAGALAFAVTKPPRSRVLAVVGLGLVFEVGHALARTSIANYAVNFGAGFGLAALLVASYDAVTAGGDAKAPARLRLTEVALFGAFLFVARLFVELTVLLHPMSFDASFYAADGVLFGGQPSFGVGRLFNATQPVRYLEMFVYVALPIACTVIYALERKKRRGVDVQVAFVVAGLVGCSLYHLLPVAGPTHAFRGLFPAKPPPADAALQIPYLAGTAIRNAIPSLHTTWSLLLYWHARRFSVAVRAFGAAWLGLTIVAMLGLGEHYLIDVVVSIPFAVALRASMGRIPLRERARWLPIACGGVLFMAWVVLFRVSSPLFWERPVVIALSVVSVVAPLLLESRLARLERDADLETEEGNVASPNVPALPPPIAPVQSRTALVVACIFFASGFAGLVYEVMFAKSLALVFGSSSTASSTVLATYMGGMALGSYVGGRIRARSALKAYAYCELGVGLCCAIAPFVVPLIRGLYISIASGGDPGRPSLTALQVALGAAVLLPPTVLMGMTMPILGRFFQKDDPTLGRSVGLLYAANTSGAAAGALVTGYLLIPSLGILQTTMVGVVANFAVALAAMRLDSRRGALSAPLAKEMATNDEGSSEEAAESQPAEHASLAPDHVRKRLGAIGFSLLFFGGIVTLALEVTYIHLLAVVVGNSTFAFSSMLVAFLVGLSGGAAVGRTWLRRGGSIGVGVALAQGGIVLTVLLGVFVWNAVPDYLAQYEGYGIARTFAISEFIRFVVCAGLLVPPAAFIGASYPLAIECVGRSVVSDRVRALGTAAAANTLGNILGALGASFVLVPRLGSLRTLHLLMLASLLLSAMPILVTDGGRRRAVFAVCGVGLALFAVQPSTFNLSRLATGANVYFAAQHYGKTIDHAESSDGGLTTVAVSKDKDGTPVKTLLTNGKFQGDDSPVREMTAQYAIGLFPMLHTSARGRALVVGLGTGVSSRVVHDAGYREVHVAELSRDIIDLARRHFQRVNGGVLDRPNVRTYVTDGRNYLMLQPEKYDLIGIEISSIWFAGAATLYNREFYELTKTRLTDDGVLQQWFQYHHIDQLDIASILASIRAVYPRVWVYFAGRQGIMVACQHDCRPTAETLAKMDDQVSLRDGLALLGGRASELLGGRVLTPEAVDALLKSVGADPKDPQKMEWLVSTDDNLFLEYHTPRGNMRPYMATLIENDRILRKFSPPDVLAGTRLTPAALPPKREPPKDEPRPVPAVPVDAGVAEAGAPSDASEAPDAGQKSTSTPGPK